MGRMGAEQGAPEHDGSRYPVKQIVSMATGVPVSEFSGGTAPGDANAFASARGFEIVELRPGRNPTWVRDELILALDLYLRYAGNPPGKDSTEIIELSETLNHLARYLRLTRAERFRNANGVYMKLMNFRRFDPVFTEAGKVGLTRGGKTEEEVWADFTHDPARCHQIAETIKRVLATAPDEAPTVVDLADDDIAEAEEGRVVTTLHRRYERHIGIVKAKKARALALLGRLVCEACGFDFGQRYGQRGEGFIECHHTRPLHTLKPGEKTKAKDLRLLCANCHRMVHATRRWLSFEELVAIFRDPGTRHEPTDASASKRQPSRR
jgi:predicted HNH restriction endonuclease